MSHPLREPRQRRPHGWAGTILDTATSLQDRVRVRIDAFQDSRRSFGPMPFMPGGALPAEGDRCLVMFDEAGQPWAVAWETEGSLVSASHAADTTDVHGIADTAALYRAGGTDVAIADGGTGASTAAGARTALDVPSNAEAILDTIVDAKGDLIAGSASDAPMRKAVGTNGQVLVANSSEATGLEWSGGITNCPENLREIRGIVNANGTIAKGAGFTVSKTGTGAYTVTFSTVFSDTPAFTGNCEGFTGIVQINVPAAGSVSLLTVATTTGAVGDSKFHFTATGPR